MSFYELVQPLLIWIPYEDLELTTVVEEFIQLWTKSLQAANIMVADSDSNPIHSVAFEPGLQDLV